ncbi:hypothetical protein AMAG_19221 [Allomyces macrogynus ATCC 38327]|uniref:Uncharacterized protein n=1 Tax=Allomyces macrogynus (strain ATCC 38327) TaxID=578462 RepID=A0A0L0STV0_ALLM3|nr:hypothetical protein AMAG_19221 [Allomyces macrogynus ATCC 38327]|eukprot:KNE65830.1 hypothetical protein AMAG_19221 [Allomyces macrogynus ATCC 38327]
MSSPSLSPVRSRAWIRFNWAPRRGAARRRGQVLVVRVRLGRGGRRHVDGRHTLVLVLGRRDARLVVVLVVVVAVTNLGRLVQRAHRRGLGPVQAARGRRRRVSVRPRLRRHPHPLGGPVQFLEPLGDILERHRPLPLEDRERVERVEPAVIHFHAHGRPDRRQTFPPLERLVAQDLVGADLHEDRRQAAQHVARRVERRDERVRRWERVREAVEVFDDARQVRG